MAGTQVAEKKEAGISAYLANEAVRENIARVIGKPAVATFVSSIVSATQANPELAKCDKASILSAALMGESLKLTPSPQMGQYYMVPYNKKAQFQMGYKGYLQLAARSGQYKKIVVTEVKEGELISYNPITEEMVFNPVTDATKREGLKTIGYYGMFVLTNGYTKEIYWPMEQMKAHAKQYSPAYRNDIEKKTSYSFWSKNFDIMAQKTILRQLISKWGPMSVEMEKAYEADMAAIDEEGNIEYVDSNQSVEEEVAGQIASKANTVEFEEVPDGQMEIVK